MIPGLLFNSNAPRSRLSEWKNTDRNEMFTFIALLIHTGTIKVNRLNEYWKKHHLFDMSCFSNYMSRDRFLNLMRCFHFAPNVETNDQNLPDDRLYKIRPLITYFNNKVNTIYYPKKELSLDESMVLWRGRLQFIVIQHAYADRCTNNAQFIQHPAVPQHPDVPQHTSGCCGTSEY